MTARPARFMCVLLIALLLAACTERIMLEPVVTSATIETPLDLLFPGDTTPLTPIVQDEKGQYLLLDTVAWWSSDTTVVRVTANGRAVAVRAGDAVVRMRYRDAQAEHAFHVDAGFVEIEAGAAATCAFKQDRELWCWGSNWTIGNSFADPSTAIPRRIQTDQQFTQLTIGARHICALNAQGAAYCWGSPNAGADGSGHLRDFSSVPRPVVTNLRFTAITAGWEHSCALTADGTAYCWGRNYEKQLGRNDVGVSYAVIPVDTELRFKQLQAAGSNTCGLTLDGDAYCWGDWRGYLGDSTVVENQAKPLRIKVPKLRLFDSANDDPCGIAFDGDLWCWTDKVEHLPGVGKVTDVTVGSNYACITLAADSSIRCYGKNNYGQLGDGTNAERPSPITPAGGLVFRQVSAGALHTCGVTDTGATYCWGYNSDGQLGEGSRAHAAAPRRVLLVH